MVNSMLGGFLMSRKSGGYATLMTSGHSSHIESVSKIKIDLVMGEPLACLSLTVCPNRKNIKAVGQRGRLMFLQHVA